MKTDTTGTRYSQRADAVDEFDRAELRHCNTILRRLQFLEVKVRESVAKGQQPQGGAAWAEYEMLSLEWALVELGFLHVSEPTHTEVSGNPNHRRR